MTGYETAAAGGGGKKRGRDSRFAGEAATMKAGGKLINHKAPHKKTETKKPKKAAQAGAGAGAGAGAKSSSAAPAADLAGWEVC